jgi:hypothetical protein
MKMILSWLQHQGYNRIHVSNNSSNLSTFNLQNLLLVSHFTFLCSLIKAYFSIMDPLFHLCCPAKTCMLIINAFAFCLLSACSRWYFLLWIFLFHISLKGHSLFSIYSFWLNQNGHFHWFFSSFRNVRKPYLFLWFSQRLHFRIEADRLYIQGYIW